MPIVQPNRKWVRDGPLGLIVGATDIRPRFVFLFTDVLVLTVNVVVEPPSKKDKKAAVDPQAAHTTMHRFQREMSMLSASVQGIKEDPGAETPLHGFVVRSPKLAFAFQASSEEEKISWMKVCEKAFLHFYWNCAHYLNRPLFLSLSCARRGTNRASTLPPYEEPQSHHANQTHSRCLHDHPLYQQMSVALAKWPLEPVRVRKGSRMSIPSNFRKP
jgi:hypothetical protein